MQLLNILYTPLTAWIKDTCKNSFDLRSSIFFLKIFSQPKYFIVFIPSMTSLLRPTLLSFHFIYFSLKTYKKRKMKRMIDLLAHSALSLFCVLRTNRLQWGYWRWKWLPKNWVQLIRNPQSCSRLNRAQCSFGLN